jgi:transcription termination factor Rho
MTVFERAELEASPLADLHAIAGQVGLEGFRRLRKADLIAAIVTETGSGTAESSSAESSSAEADEEEQDAAPSTRTRRRRPSRSRRSREESDATEPEDGAPPKASAPAKTSASAKASPPAKTSARAESGETASETARIAAGVVEVLGNGSAFLRVDPPEPSDDDVYISAAQVRRCELVSGDRVTGPVRTPRRSERYPSLVRIDTINGASADTVSDGGRYDELAVEWPCERLALGAQDPTLEAIEWLTPLGRGSRAVIVGTAHAGKTETLRRVLESLQGREDLELSLVLLASRPEEIAQWREGPHTPVAALTFAASAEQQEQALERALDAAKRVAARGGNALVAIDGLDGVHPHAARKALAAARNLREGGSLTVIALAKEPFGGETTVIALDATLALTGRQPILDLAHSATLKPELLVGEDGAEAIAKARLAAVEAVA